jgi:hypothetical protein
MKNQLVERKKICFVSPIVVHNRKSKQRLFFYG